MPVLVGDVRRVASVAIVEPVASRHPSPLTALRPYRFKGWNQRIESATTGPQPGADCHEVREALRPRHRDVSRFRTLPFQMPKYAKAAGLALWNNDSAADYFRDTYVVFRN
jgi:hypothetical protein